LLAGDIMSFRLPAVFCFLLSLPSPSARGQTLRARTPLPTAQLALVQRHATFPQVVQSAYGTPKFQAFVQAALAKERAYSATGGGSFGPFLVAMNQADAARKLGEAEEALVVAHTEETSVQLSPEVTQLVYQHAKRPQDVLAARGSAGFAGFVRAALEARRAASAQSGTGGASPLLLATRRSSAERALRESEQKVVFGVSAQ
jgi:hypothetical protein